MFPFVELSRRDPAFSGTRLVPWWPARASHVEEPGQEGWGHHREHQKESDDDVDDVDGDVLQPQRAGDGGDQQYSAEYAVQGTAAAEDRDAAEQHRRDHLELQTGGVVAAGTPEAQRVV